MWQRFTEQARKAVVAAQAEAEQDGSALVQSYHLLLGVTREADSKAVRIFEKFGVSPQRVRDEIRNSLPTPRQQEASSGRERNYEKLFSDQAKHVLQMAYNGARQLSPNHVGTEHLLIGLLADPEDVPARVLQHLGIGLDQVRAEVAELAEKGLGEALEERSAEARALDMPYSHKATLAFQTAHDAAREMKHNQVGTAHLLLGLLADGEDVPAQALQHFGIGLDQVRKKVAELGDEGLGESR